MTIEVSSYFIHDDSKISICVAMVILTSFGIPDEDSAIEKVGLLCYRIVPP
jgi:hypothetical protein